MNCCEASRRMQILDEDNFDLYENRREQVKSLDKNTSDFTRNHQFNQQSNDDDYVIINGRRPRQQFKSETATKAAIEQSTFSDETSSARPQQQQQRLFSCKDFHLNAKTLEFRLKSVANCLAYLLQEPNSSNKQTDDATKYQTNSNCCSGGGDFSSDGSVGYQLGMIEQRDSFMRDRFKLRRIMLIHSILLRISPIEAQVNDSNWIMALMIKRSKSLDVARQQVLNLIENLNGYCDSIDLLRCIFRTPYMAQVMLAFDEIIINVNAQLKLQKKLTKNGLLNLVSGSDGINIVAPKVEFRIVREWTV